MTTAGVLAQCVYSPELEHALIVALIALVAALDRAHHHRTRAAAAVAERDARVKRPDS